MIDNENIIKTVSNKCEVTLIFQKEPNLQIQQNVLDILLYAYDKRVGNVLENNVDGLSN